MLRKLPTQTTAPLFSTLVFAGFHDQSPLLTMLEHCDTMGRAWLPLACISCTFQLVHVYKINLFFQVKSAQ